MTKRIDLLERPGSHFPIGRSVQIADPRETAAPRLPHSSSIGLGDVLAFLTRWSGLHALWQLRGRITGKPCGCQARRRRWNRIRFRLPISWGGSRRDFRE